MNLNDCYDVTDRNTPQGGRGVFLDEERPFIQQPVYTMVDVLADKEVIEL